VKNTSIFPIPSITSIYFPSIEQATGAKGSLVAPLKTHDIIVLILLLLHSVKTDSQNPRKEAFCPKRKVFSREQTYPLPTVHKGLPRHDAENKHIQIYTYV